MARTAAPRRALAGLAGVTVGGVALSAVVASGGPILARRWALLAWLAVWAVLWVAGVALAFRLPRRASVAAVLVAATGLRLAALAGPPNLSDDLYRYAWDGRAQLAGINPYRYPPDDPALVSLREGWLWPGAAGCEAIERPPGCTRINRPHAPTIYPPLAEAYFAGVYRLAGIDARDKAWQVAALAADLLLVGLLPLALRAWAHDERWTALYALSPIPVVELVGNAHVDGVAALAVVAALLVVGRRRDRTWLAGVLVGAATLVKLYPAVVLAALPTGWRPGARPRGVRRWAAFVPVVVACGAVVALGYLPHIAVVGPEVVGYLPGYLSEEGYDRGGRFLLTSLASPPGAATVVAGAAFAGVVAAVLWRRPAPPTAAAALLGGLLLVSTPVQPWYAVTLLAVATVAARPAWAAVAAAAYPYFFAVILDHPDPVAIGRLGYGAGLAVVLVDSWRRRRRRTGGPAAAPSPIG